MNRIVIIGSPGSGKSTLARKLGRKLQIQVVHLDRIFWQPGWKEKPRNRRIEILQERIRKKKWIIEGTYLDSSEPRLKAADTIIFLDIPFYICFQRIFVQRFMHQGEYRHDINEGCKDRLNMKRILKVLVFPIRGRIALKRKLRSYESKQIFWLRSSREIQDFLEQLQQGVDYNQEPTLLCTSTSTKYWAFHKLAKMQSK
jgi:adenylate kinase family enzyme